MRKILVLTTLVCVLCLSPVAQVYAANLYITGPFLTSSAYESYILAENRDQKYPAHVYVRWYDLTSTGNTLFTSGDFVLNPNSTGVIATNVSSLFLYAVEVGICGTGAGKTVPTHLAFDSAGNSVPAQRVLAPEFTKSNTFVCP